MDRRFKSRKGVINVVWIKVPDFVTIDHWNLSTDTFWGIVDLTEKQGYIHHSRPTLTLIHTHLKIHRTVKKRGRRLKIQRTYPILIAAILPFTNKSSLPFYISLPVAYILLQSRPALSRLLANLTNLFFLLSFHQLHCFPHKALALEHNDLYCCSNVITRCNVRTSEPLMWRHRHLTTAKQPTHAPLRSKYDVRDYFVTTSNIVNELFCFLR